MKTSALTLIFLALHWQSISNANVGFYDGNQFTSINVSGNVQVQCSGGGVSTGFFQCEEQLVSPVAESYFVGPNGVQADAFSLTAQHADGTTEKKSGSYNSSAGHSRFQVNLLLASLLQTPLLDLGSNNIAYELTSSGKSVASGQFSVSLREGADRQCQGTFFYNSTNSEDCTNSTNACTQMFNATQDCSQ